jgi:hypothetical protein
MVLGGGVGAEDMVCSCTSASSGSRSAILLKAELWRWNDSRLLADGASSMCLGDFDGGAVEGSVGG